MGESFCDWDIDQLMMIPLSVEDFVLQGHVAHFVRNTVSEALDLSAIVDCYNEERGYPPYHPVMMTALLLYAYCQGIYPSRRIAKACRERVDFMAVTGMQTPDFRTISDFRKRHMAALKELFVQVLRLCQEAGLVKLGKVAIDGTKVKANASKHKAMSYGRMKQKESEISRRVREIMKRAEQIDAEEDRLYGPDKSGSELPEELATKQGRLKKIREAKAALEAKAREKATSEGKDPDEAEPTDKSQRNFTDPDSQIQKTND